MFQARDAETPGTGSLHPRGPRSRCGCSATVREARCVAIFVPVRGGIVKSGIVKRVSAALLVVGVAAAARAQEAPLTRSASPAEALAPLSEVPVLDAPPIVPLIRVAQEQAADASRLADVADLAAGGPYRFADPYAVEATPVTHGRWETSADGRTAVWRLRAASEGAVSLNLGFTSYRMPPGGRLWVYAADGSEVLGPFTEDDNQAHGELWTPVLGGDEVVIEVAVPEDRRAELDLRLGSVNRGFRDLLGSTVSHYHGRCHIDVACSGGDDWRDQVSSVAMYHVGGGSRCSGVLLNNTALDRKPYFLTAEHCVSSSAEAARIVVYWNYQSATCGARNGPLAEHQSGATLVASWPTWIPPAEGTAGVVEVPRDHLPVGTDFSLLLLSEEPVAADPPAYFAGWSRAAEAPATGVAIHHPMTHVKSMSFDYNPLTITEGGARWHAVFDDGAGEGGSSGGALFDPNKRVVGQWRGGNAHCRSSHKWADFGRLAMSWTGGGTKETRLSDWLDPGGAGDMAIDGLWMNRPAQNAEPMYSLALKLADGARSVDVSHAFLDRDGDALTYAAASSDETIVTATISGSSVVVTPVAAGLASVTVSATDVDGTNTAHERDLAVTVGANASPAPVGSLADVQVMVGESAVPADVASAFQDPDGDALTYAATSSKAAVATVTLAGSTLSVEPVGAGAARISVTATDAAGSGTTAIQQFAVEVLPNQPPVAVGALADISMNQNSAGRTVDVSAAFKDPEDDALTYEAASSESGVVTATVTNASVKLVPKGTGTATVTVTADDEPESNASARQQFAVTVRNDAPEAVGTIAAPSLRVGDGAGTVAVSGAFRDADLDALTYSARTDEPAIVGVAVSGATLSLTPKSRGAATVTVTATDAGGSNSQATQTFDVRVRSKRGVSLSKSSLSVVEGESGSYDVALTSEPTGTVTVTPSAAAGAEVTLAPASLEFGPSDWASARTVTVTAPHDADALADAKSSILHAVSGADYGNVAAPPLDVVVVEDDVPTLSVESPAGVAESDGSVEFEVTLSVASSRTVTVAYATSDGTGAGGASASSDYEAASGTLSFSPGSLSRQVTVDVLDDAVDEAESETLGFTLSNPMHAVLAGGGSTLRVSGTILDDDDPTVSVSFGASGYTVSEGASARIPVRLDRDPERRVEVVLVATEQGGASAADYSGVPANVVFDQGVTSAEFLFVATDDGEADAGESVEIGFGSPPDRVTVGDAATVRISDDDPPPGPGPPPPPPSPPPPGPAPPPPGGSLRAAFSVGVECESEPCIVFTGEPVRFQDTSSGPVGVRRWEFGDGSVSRSSSPAHKWNAPGFYEVRLEVSDGVGEDGMSMIFLVEAAEPAGDCRHQKTSRCLRKSRYEVAVDWFGAGGASGAGTVVHAGTDDSGLFRFFDPDNWEVLVKVLDGCAVNGHVWVFAASTTDLGYAIRVTDTTDGEQRLYRNEPGEPAAGVTDVRAFPEACEPD